jgi:hypothetical protein
MKTGLNIEELREAAETMEAALEDFAKFGIRADTNPTVVGTPPTMFWYNYLDDADRHVKQRAKAALPKVPR